MYYHDTNYFVIFVFVYQSTHNNHLFSRDYIFRECINICITLLPFYYLNSIELNCNTFLSDFILQYRLLN